MRTILVATDFSTRSDRALRRATLVARAIDGGLALVHVVDDDQPDQLVEVERRMANGLIADLAATVRAVDGLPCRAEVLTGEPFDAIDAAAVAAGADLVVMGPHRRQALRDIFVGTTVQRTIARITRPILMANAVPARPYGRVLVATDLSTSADRALAVVADLGLLAGMEAAVLHVYDAPAEDLLFRAALTEEERLRYLAERDADARRTLDAHLEARGVAIDTRMLRLVGLSVATTICDAARVYDADLVVVGTRGQSGLRRHALGSVAEELLGIAEVDVLAVPPAG